MNKIIVEVMKGDKPKVLDSQEAKSILDALKYLADLSPVDVQWYKSGTEYFWSITEYQEGHRYEPLIQLNGYFTDYFAPIVSNVHKD